MRVFSRPATNLVPGPQRVDQDGDVHPARRARHSLKDVLAEDGRSSFTEEPTVRMPNVLPCATMFALLVAASLAQAQTISHAGHHGHSPYLSTIEPLFPADPPSSCEFTRPPAAFGTFAFDFLIIERSHVDPMNLVTVDGVDVFSTTDFDFDASGAFRFTATFPSPCGVDFQFSYLGSHDFMATQTFTGGVVQDAFFGGVGTQTELYLMYEAPLDSFEMNFRARQWKRFAPLVGIRFVTLNETSFQLDVTNSVAGQSSAKNTLVGIQFGGEWLLGRAGKWRLESVLKGGVYYNDMNIEASALNVDFNRWFSTTAFVGEASLMAVYEFAPHASFRIGYQGLWLEGTALLFDQYDNFHYTTGNGSVDLGSVNFQGGYAGFDLTW